MPSPNDADRQQEQRKAHGYSHELNNVFMPSVEVFESSVSVQENYETLAGKDPRRKITIRTSMSPDTGLEIDPTCPFEKRIADLIDAPEIQRLRSVRQLSGSYIAFPGASHSRFEHVLGSAKLTTTALKAIKANVSETRRAEIDEWGPVVVAFAMLHDLGHIAPGSHMAQRVWFPDSEDYHEEVSHALLQCPGLAARLSHSLGDMGYQRLLSVVQEGDATELVPPWTWQLITGGGWNTDRGDWVKRDSKQCGVLYGDYDPTIILKNLSISTDGELAIREGAVGALSSFFMARAQMYTNVYGDETCRIGERLHELVGRRARELFYQGNLPYVDSPVQNFLLAKDIRDVPPEEILAMQDHVWEYHVTKWAHLSDDLILSSLCRSLLIRDLPKVFKAPEIVQSAQKIVQEQKLPERYFILRFKENGPNLQKDLNKAIKVLGPNNEGLSLAEHDELFQAYSLMNKLHPKEFTAIHPSLVAGIQAH